MATTIRAPRHRQPPVPVPGALLRLAGAGAVSLLALLVISVFPPGWTETEMRLRPATAADGAVPDRLRRAEADRAAVRGFDLTLAESSDDVFVPAAELLAVGGGEQEQRQEQAPRGRRGPPCSCARGAPCVFCNQSPFPPYALSGRRRGCRGRDEPSPLPSERDGSSSRRGAAVGGSSPEAELRLRVSRVFCTGYAEKELFNWPGPGQKPATLHEKYWNQSTCLFRDLLWMPEAERWLFVRDPRHKPAWDFPGNVAMDKVEFPQRTPPNLRWLLARDFGFLDVDVSPGGSDIGSVRPQSFRRYASLALLARARADRWHVLAAHKWTRSEGCDEAHFAVNFTWPSFAMMRASRALAIDNVFVFAGGAVDRSVSCDESVIAGAFSQLSREPWRTLNSFRRPVQFPMLVAGDGERRWDSRVFAEPFAAREFRDFVYTTLGIKGLWHDSVDLPPPPLILIRAKRTGGRRLLNVVELVTSWRKTFPRARVFAFEPSCMSVDAEIRLMSQTAVLVTAPGAQSYASAFLPNGAAAIFLESCWPCVRELFNASDPIVPVSLYGPNEGNGTCCAKLEASLWSEMPFLDLYYTHRDRSSLYFDAVDDGSSDYPYLDYSYAADQQQLTELVEEALDRTGFSGHVDS
jgi:Glycosyltransferase 61